MRQTVREDGIRELLRRFAVDSVFQIFIARDARARNSLISRINYSLDTVLVVQRFERNDSLYRRAVRVCDYTLVPLDILGIYFGNDKGHFGVHTPRGAVVYNNAAVCRGDWREFFTCRAARREKRDVKALVKAMFREFLDFVLLTEEFKFFARRTRRSQKRVIRFKVVLLADLQKGSADHARCADDGDFQILHFDHSYQYTTKKFYVLLPR